MNRQQLAAQIIIVGLLLGIFGNILFHPYLTDDFDFDLIPILGIGFPIFVTTVIGAGFLLARRYRVPLGLRRIWLVVPILFFAMMVAVRGDWVIMVVNIMAVFALGGLLLHYLPKKHYLDEATTVEYSLSLIVAGVVSAVMPPFELLYLRGWFKSLDLRKSKGFVAVGRGLLLATPVLIVFVILLGSADVIFAERIGNIFSNLLPSNAESLITQVIFIGIIAYVIIGLIAYGLVRAVEAIHADTIEPPSDRNTTEARKRGGGLGMIEAGIMLGSVNLLFLFFVFIQLQYLFGGEETIAAGFTYATYARRGFFELVAVTMLVLALGLWLDRATLRRSTMHTTVFRGMAIVMVALTLIMLVSAWHRMSLYEMAFGYTRLRIYTHIFMLALAALLGAFLLQLFRVKPAIFSFSLLLVMIAYLGVLNLLNVENFVAWHNIQRDTSEVELDICYLRTFSVDALPAMLHLYENGDSATERQHALLWMQEKWNTLDMHDTKPISMLNFAHQSAYTQLESMRTDFLELSNPSNEFNCRYW